MSMPLTDRINSLTSQANEVTGASDTTLSDAITTLIAGYGGGGETNVHFGTFTAASPISSDYSIPHGFDSKPSVFCVYNDTNDNKAYRRFVFRSNSENGDFGIFGNNAGNGNKNDLRANQAAYAYATSENIVLAPNSTPWGAGNYVWFAIKLDN